MATYYDGPKLLDSYTAYETKNLGVAFYAVTSGTYAEVYLYSANSGNIQVLLNGNTLLIDSANFSIESPLFLRLAGGDQLVSTQASQQLTFHRLVFEDPNPGTP